jgi:predicted DNA-binding transcriptional regulator AlpA
MDAVTQEQPDVVNARQVCKRLGISPVTLRLMVSTGACPKPLPMPGLKPRWARRAWDRWLETGGKR